MLRSVWTPNCRMRVALEILSVQEHLHKDLAGIHDANARMAKATSVAFRKRLDILR